MPTLTDEPLPSTSTSDEAMPVLTMITPIDPQSKVTVEAPMYPAPAVLLINLIQNISNKRNGASSTQMSQAAWMVKRSKVVLGAGQAGDNVSVPILIVDSSLINAKKHIYKCLDANVDYLYLEYLE